LIGLAKRCLSADPADRPREAGGLAGDLTAYLGSAEARLRRAELEGAAAQARAVEERRRRRVQLGLAAAVLALVAVGAGGGLWAQHEAGERRAEQARRDAEQRQAVEFALEKAAGLRQQARWREAQAVLEQARQRLGDSGPDDLRRRLGAAETELALVNRLDAIRQRIATWVEESFDTQTAERDYADAFAAAGLGKVGDDAEEVTARVQASSVYRPLVAALDDWAWVTRDVGARKWLLGVARRADPDPWRNRLRDPEVWSDRQALQQLADEALRDDGAKLDELSPQLLESFGWRLRGSRADAVPLFRSAQGRHPDDFWLNLDLAHVLDEAGRWEEAVGYNRVAVALRPDVAAARNNLGTALAMKGDVEGAIAQFHKAIELDSRFAPAHYNLGKVLHAKKDLDGASAAYKRATEFAPKYAPAHCNLGKVLHAKKDLDGASAEYRKAIELAPKHAEAHAGLGAALADKKDLDGAMAEYRKAIASDRKHAAAHGLLGGALAMQGRFAEARTALRRCLELLPQGDPLHQPVSQELQECERLLALDEKLPAVLQGEAEPTGAAERLALAQLCWQYKHWHTAAVRFYAEAFVADPKLADDLRQLHRCNAACSAALAAAGQAEDAKNLPDKVQLMLRRQALRWLRADLALYAKLAERDDPTARRAVRQGLEHWLEDTDLISVRDKAALERLPDGERDAWRQLWADVEALLQRVSEKPK
jgi:tetratricopeptide (TPR) repeat protein